MDKEAVKRNFSKYARYYDRYSSVQNHCASKLLSKVKKNGCRKILDIGCGTGNYTVLLKEAFPIARIKAVDISEEMIKIASEKLHDERIEFAVADGERLDLRERFDLISSNASFQWFEDLDKALLRYKRLLTEGGEIVFSTFGPLTLYELDLSLKELFGGGMSISSLNFVEREAVRKTLKSVFKDIEIEQELYKEDNASLSELLKKIKYTGTRGNGFGARRFWTPRLIGDLEKIYRKNFGTLPATYQIFFCKGRKGGDGSSLSFCPI